MDWQPIESIPEELKDGREVYVKRMSPSRADHVVAEGWAVFGVCHRDAPQRQSLGVDPLGRLSASDYDREDRERLKWAETAKWLKPDQLYSFPAPTHWSPSPPEKDEG